MVKKVGGEFHSRSLPVPLTNKIQYYAAQENIEKKVSAMLQRHAWDKGCTESDFDAVNGH